MSVNFRTLGVNLGILIHELSSQQVIWSNQNVPAPDGEYIALQIKNFAMIGQDYESKPDINEDIDVQGDRELVLSLMAVSEDAMGILLKVLDRICLESNNILLENKKLAFVSVVNGPLDITTTINSEFETSASLELLFRIGKNYYSDDQYSKEAVSSVEISGSVKASDTSEPFVIDINVV